MCVIKRNCGLRNSILRGTDTVGRSLVEIKAPRVHFFSFSLINSTTSLFKSNHGRWKIQEAPARRWQNLQSPYRSCAHQVKHRMAFRCSAAVHHRTCVQTKQLTAVLMCNPCALFHSFFTLFLCSTVIETDLVETHLASLQRAPALDPDPSPSLRKRLSLQ